MRAKEFITEQKVSNVPATNLISVLDTLRNRFADLGQEPRVRVDSLVNMVRKIPGSEMFNVDTLKKFYDDPELTVKNYISDIRQDDDRNTVIYLKPAIGQVGNIETEPEPEETPDIGDGDVEAGVGPENTVHQMSKRALNRRS